MAENSTPGQRWGSNTRWVQQDEGRRAIIDAAVRSFEAKGMKATTMDDIARGANITRRTVYHYFKAKSEILEAAAEQHACDCVERMAIAVPADLAFTDFIERCLLYMIETVPREPFYKIETSDSVGIEASYLFFTSRRVNEVWLEAFRPPYIEALRRREINPDLRLEDIIEWVGRIALSYLQYPNPNANLETIQQELRQFFINALIHGA